MQGRNRGRQHGLWQNVGMLDSRISIRLNPVLLRRLRLEARERHMTLSALIREVLEEHIAGREPRMRKGSHRSLRLH